MSFIHPDVDMVHTFPPVNDTTMSISSKIPGTTSENDMLRQHEKDRSPTPNPERVSIKIVMLKIEATSPLLPTKAHEYNNNTSFNNKNSSDNTNSTLTSPHLSGERQENTLTTSCPTNNQEFKSLNSLNYSISPTSHEAIADPTEVSSRLCRRRSSVSSILRQEGSQINKSAPVADDHSSDTNINLPDNNYNIKETNFPEIPYNSCKYSRPYNTHYQHSRDCNNFEQNYYPNDTFSLIEGKAPRSSTKMETKDDAVGRITGHWGKWQLRTVLLIFLCKIPSSWFMACIIFTAPAPRHGEFFCKPPNTIGAQNQSIWIKVSHPIKEEVDEEFSIDFCNVYEDAQQHAHHYYKYFHRDLEPRIWEEPLLRNSNVIPCTDFQHQADFHSVVTQYDLVCSRDILVSVTQFFHLFGVLTGGILANHLLKHFSPRYVMLFGMVSQIICGNLTGLVASYELHVFFRCLSAVCCAQMYTAGGMIMADITGGIYKTCVSTLFEQFWSIGVMLLPGLASFFSSWTHLYMAISWPTVILIYLWQWIPDSPRWMIARGRVLEAKKILLECANVNGTRYNLPPNIDQQLQLQAMTAMDADAPPSWWSLFKGHRAVRHMICVHLCWSLYIIVYYGMLLNIRSFSREHLDINTAVAGFSEMMGTFIGLFLILFTEHKWKWTGLFNIVAGCIAYCGWLVPKNISTDSRVALLMFTAMVSKSAISCTLSILTTCTVELVSEEKKRLCAFSTICWARFWLLFAPFIGATVIFGQLIPQTAFASLAMTGGVISMFISSPRTINKQHGSKLNVNMVATMQRDSSQVKFNSDINTNILFSSPRNNSATPPRIWTTKNHKDSQQPV